MKIKITTNKQRINLPISSVFWELEEVTTLNINNCVSEHYNTSKLAGRPFYKSISKIFDFK